MSIFYLKKVLANLTCIAQATNSLLKSSLLSWIEVQLLHSTTESVVWISKMLENILIVVDKIDASSTNGEWRSVDVLISS